MTNEEAKENLEQIRSYIESLFTLTTGDEKHVRWANATLRGIDAIEMVEAMDEFIRFVVSEIMDEDGWELNSDSFPEIACRKLQRLGYVEEKDGYWVAEVDDEHV